MRTLVLLSVFILFGIIIYILRSYTGKNAEKKEEAAEPEVTECCGAHEICEKTGMYNPKFQPDYYDDEELDQFKGVNPESYSDEQIAMFEEVLMTMKESDVAGWVKSLQMREIEMPYSVREKALMILG